MIIRCILKRTDKYNSECLKSDSLLVTNSYGFNSHNKFYKKVINYLYSTDKHFVKDSILYLEHLDLHKRISVILKNTPCISKIVFDVYRESGNKTTGFKIKRYQIDVVRPLNSKAMFVFSSDGGDFKIVKNNPDFINDLIKRFERGDNFNY